MQPTKSGDWEYIKNKLVKALEKADEDQEELDDLWKDMNEDELDELDVTDAPFTVPLIGGDAATINRLANDESVTNLGLRVQPEGKCMSQLEERKGKVEDWTNRAKTGHLPARGVWQSYSQQFWSSMKYGLGACCGTLPSVTDGSYMEHLHCNISGAGWIIQDRATGK